MSDENKKKRGGDDNGKSFWQTLPGIITAITGLIGAVTALIVALSDADLIGAGPTPTAFPTYTAVDVDQIVPTPVITTPEPTEATISVPSCQAFIEYDDKVNPNAVLLAYTDSEMWVQYGGFDEAVASLEGVTAYIFDTSENGGNCLRSWVRYLLVDRTPHWPTAGSDTGRTYHEVWLSSPSPTIIGELAYWPGVPDTILITTVNPDASPDSARIYLCGADVPAEELNRTAYWHAGTSEEALQDHLEQYASSGYSVLTTVPCSNS